jgi:hypothetical protein
MSDNTKSTPPIKNQVFQTQTLAQQIEMVNMVIGNLKDRKERSEHDVGIDGLQNRAN